MAAYPAAIAEYKASLAYADNYFWAHKQLGNCFYAMGDRAQALAEYELYLKSNRKDVQVQKIVDLLKDAKPERVEEPDDPFRFFGIEVNGGYGTYALSEYNQAASAGHLSGAHGGGEGSINLRFRFMPRLLVEGGIQFMSISAVGKKDTSSVGGGYVISDHLDEEYDFPIMSTQLGVSYVAPLFAAKSLFLRAGGFITYDALTGAGLKSTEKYSSVGGGSVVSWEKTQTDNFSGSGVGARGQIGADWFFGEHFSITANVGYRHLKIPSIAVGSGGNLMSVTGQDVALDFSGFLTNVGVCWWL